MTRRYTRQRRGAVGAVVAVCLLVTGLPRIGRTQSPTYSENEIKSAFLYNFAKFVEWPKGAFTTPDAPLLIGVLEDAAFTEAIERTVKQHSVGERPIAIRRLATPEDTSQVHIAFLGTSNRTVWEQVFAACAGRPVLLIGDAKGFAETGGIINFRRRNGKISFEINPDAAKRANLKISSRLLSLAAIVTDGEE